MTQRVQSNSPAYNDHPFTNQGASLYITDTTVTSTIQYRNLRVHGNTSRRKRCNRWVKGSSTGVDKFHDIANAVTKTSRLDTISSPTTTFTTAIPASMIPGGGTNEVIVDIRHYKDDVENENDNFGTIRLTIDTAGTSSDQIYGIGNLISTQIRAGGIVRIKFLWSPNVIGIQPDTFTAISTAGPSSPSNASVTGNGDLITKIIEIDTPVLLDSSGYTYKIEASNGATTNDIITAITFTADNTGPDTPTAITTTDY